LSEWDEKAEEAEMRLTDAFEIWLGRRTRAELEQIVRLIWKTPSLRLWFLPYQEILRIRDELMKRAGETG